MRDFKTVAALLIFVLMVTACLVAVPYISSTPAPNVSANTRAAPVVNNDPNSAAAKKARAEAALQQAQQLEADANAAAANETAQANANANAANDPATQAALSAEQTAQALNAAQQQGEATVTAEAVSAKQTAQEGKAQATSDSRAVLLAQQVSEATATAEAMQRAGITAGQVADASQQQRELLAWLIPLGAALVFGVVLLLGAKYINGAIHAANERRALENQRLALLGTLFTAPNETIVFAIDPETGFSSARMLNAPSATIDAEVVPFVVALSAGDQLLADSAEAREEAVRFKLAMKLLRDAISQQGAQANLIPSAAELGWPTWAWSSAVAVLRPYGVETLQGAEGGTYLVGQWPTLQGLYIAIGEQRLTLYPMPGDSPAAA